MKTLIKTFKGKEFIFNLEDALADKLLLKDKRYREQEKKSGFAPRQQRER